MAFPKIKDIQDLGYDDINKEILSLKKEIFDLKFKQATRQPIKTHLFKHKKHKLAQLFTRQQQLLR